MPKQIVTSKYFQKLVMDESLSDFQEKKKSCVGPKSNQRAKVNNKKPKRRIKGQKDIRTLIKSNKNELLSFTKDFNSVCKKSGIDVDCEELQLAIALSKSLQTTEDQLEANSSTSKLTSKERTNKIRRTLQEYGFKVPEAKILLEGNKRIKRNKKQYKLLLESEEERKQKIFDKYSQVLFDNPDNFLLSGNNEDNVISSGLYFLTTNIAFELMKSNEIFYTSGLLQDICLKKSNLLKDWSDIPGRPLSPKHTEDFVVSMSEMQCTQTELDTILSGTLTVTKNICKYLTNNSPQSKINELQETEYCIDHPKGNLESASNSSEECNKLSNFPLNRKESLECDEDKCSTSRMFSLPQQSRSLSPDIFGDEMSSLIENSIVDRDVEDTSSFNPLIKKTDFIDLTETVKVISNLNDTSQNSQLSQVTNGTQRKTNDFMDLTECVQVSLRKYNNCMSQSPVMVNNNKSLENDSMEITECINPSSKSTTDEVSIDLTQKEGDESVKQVENFKLKHEAVLDLTQSPDSDEYLPDVYICSTHKGSTDDTIIVHYNDCNPLVLNSALSNKDLDHNKQRTIDLDGDENFKETNEETIVDFSEDTSYTFSNDCRENKSNIVINLQSEIKSKDIDIGSNKDEKSNIDLTQSSDSLSEMSPTIFNNVDNESNSLQISDLNKLGKKDDVSIDYDEICSGTPTIEYILDDEFDEIQSKYGTVSNTSSNSDSVLTSQHSKNNIKGFKLSNPEFNYTVNKSNVENSKSTNDTAKLYKEDKSKNSLNISTKTRSLSESYLPPVNLKNDTDEQTTETFKIKPATPIKAIIDDGKITVNTPTNNEYIVKVEEVTPMIDYSAMSSPERNKELAKYGLKPFKRKRAIQLLTHLYNQTHPIIENCSYESVPCKKLKLGSPIKKTSSKKKNISPKKIMSPLLNNELDKENNIYVETKEAPDIRDIECSADDWVFQTREKAKVHTCRVPLHIAFHNYVSCRRALREAILRYEPINIDIIHKDLVSYGYKYNPKDLLKFLDKKCITVKTADNNARNSRK